MKSQSLFWSLNFAIEGIVYALRTQRNMRIHVMLAGGVLTLGLVLDLSRFEIIAVLFAVGFVLVSELANTAIEATVDMATDGFDPLAKIAKDVAAGAVLVAAINALAVGYVVFFSGLVDAAENGFTLVKQTPLHITVIAVGLTAIAVLIVKAIVGEGMFLRGGWPSGHVALAVSAATAIAYATLSGTAAVLALFIAALVAQSRVESDVHTVPQAIFGGLLGFLITTAVFQVFFI